MPPISIDTFVDGEHTTLYITNNNVGSETVIVNGTAIYCIKMQLEALIAGTDKALKRGVYYQNSWYSPTLGYFVRKEYWNDLDSKPGIKSDYYDVRLISFNN